MGILIQRLGLLFGVPVGLLTLVFFLARKRVPWLQAVPLWIVLAVILVAVLVAVLITFLKWRSERKQAEAIEQGLLNEAQASIDNARPANRDQLEEIKKNLLETLAALRSGPEGKKTLYTIPWYMIIGPSKIGKTTAIKNSGLNFPGMTAARKMQGTGGTRNCDWWFSTDAIILDTAGRYAQSSDRSETEAEWFGFLDLIKRNRKKGPINGLIVGYSVDTLIQNEEMKLIEDARDLRQRVDEVVGRLGWTFPVYILFTKSDLVSGFVEFFSSLSPMERQQRFGAAFPLQEGPDQKVAERFAEKFDQVVERLRAMRIRQLAKTSQRGESWGRAFMFPEELAALRQRLNIFLETLFEPNPYRKDHPLFRGVYFCSGMQEGVPLDLVIRNIELALGGGKVPELAQVQPTSEDAYFVRDLFSRVLSPDRDLVRRAMGEGVRWLRARMVISATSVVISALLCVLIGTSCVRLDRRMQSTRSVALDLSQTQALDRVDRLSRLGKLQAQIAGSWRAFPLIVVNKVPNTAEEVFVERYRDLLTEIEEDVAADLRSAQTRGLSGREVRNALVVEELLLMPQRGKDIGSRKELKELLTTGLIELGFDDQDEIGNDGRASLDAIADDFLMRNRPLLADAGIRQDELENGAERLQETHDPVVLLEELQERASGELGDISLRQLSGDRVLEGDHQLPGAFTYDGWGYVSKEIDGLDEIIERDNRIIQLAGVEPVETSAVRQDLIEQYREDLADEWGEFLGAVRFEPGTCPDAVQVYKGLKRSRSPLRRLVRELAKLAGPGGEAGKLTQIADGDGAKIRETLAPVSRIVEEGEDGAWLDEYMDELGELHGAIEALCAEGTPIPRPTLESVEDAIDAYIGQFPSTPLTEGLEGLLKLPVTAAGTAEQQKVNAVRWQATQDARAQVNQEWGKIAVFWSENLSDRYPFDATASQKASWKDVCALMARGGKLDGFREFLAGFREQNPQVQVGDQLDECFRQLDAIRGSIDLTPERLRYQFRLKIALPAALRSDGGVQGQRNAERFNQLDLSVCGQTVSAYQGSPKEQGFGVSTDEQTDLRSSIVLYRDERIPLAKIETSESIWSWFELFDAATVGTRGSSATLTWAFPEAGLKLDATMSMIDAEECPFLQKSAFRSFTLPASVLGK